MPRSLREGTRGSVFWPTHPWPRSGLTSSQRLEGEQGQPAGGRADARAREDGPEPVVRVEGVGLPVVDVLVVTAGDEARGESNDGGRDRRGPVEVAVVADVEGLEAAELRGGHLAPGGVGEAGLRVRGVPFLRGDDLGGVHGPAGADDAGLHVDVERRPTSCSGSGDVFDRRAQRRLLLGLLGGETERGCGLDRGDGDVAAVGTLGDRDVGGVVALGNRLVVVVRARVDVLDDGLRLGAGVRARIDRGRLGRERADDDAVDDGLVGEGVQGQKGQKGHHGC